MQKVLGLDRVKGIIQRANLWRLQTVEGGMTNFMYLIFCSFRNLTIALLITIIKRNGREITGSLPPHLTPL